MGTGVGKYCKRCGEQLNYDDGFENGFCSRCLCIEGFEKGVIKGRFEALPITKKLLSERTFTKKELEIIDWYLTEYETQEGVDKEADKLRKKISKLLNNE